MGYVQLQASRLEDNALAKAAWLLVTAALSLLPAGACAQDVVRVHQVRGSLTVPNGWVAEPESGVRRVMNAQEVPPGVKQDIKRSGRPPALLLVNKHKSCPKGAFTVGSNDIWGTDPIDAANSMLRRLGSEKRLLSRTRPLATSVSGKRAAHFKASWQSMTRCSGGVAHYEFWVIENGRHWVTLAANYPADFPYKGEVTSMVTSFALD